MTQSEQIRQYNRWRRGDDSIPQPNPTELGELLEEVADRLEVLEREHQEFFDRWHEERRKNDTMALSLDALERLATEANAQPKGPVDESMD